QTTAPLVAEPGVYLLQIQRSTLLGWVGGVNHANAGVLERKSAQVPRRIDGMVEGIAWTLGLLSPEAQDLAGAQRGQESQQKTQEDQAAAFPHCIVPD